MRIEERENGCVGCPQGCVNCGRDKDYLVITYKCDSCKDEISTIYDTPYGQLCLLCYENKYVKDMNRDELLNVISKLDDDELRSLVKSDDVVDVLDDIILEEAEELPEVSYEDV